MSNLYVWKCTVDLEKHSGEELNYYPSHEYVDSYVVIASSAEEALYALNVRCCMTHCEEGTIVEEVLERVHDLSLPITEEEHAVYKAKVSKWRGVEDAVYPVRWKWVAEQITPYIGDTYTDGSVLSFSYNAG